jgi:carbon-monoxide dehydrogenase small subunit
MSDDSRGEIAVAFTLNGEARDLRLPPATRLIDILREELGLMGAKRACDIGRCGACLVLMDGRPVNACLVMVWQLAGAEVISPEGLEALPEARAVRAGLTQESAFQCGYCAPGFTVALTALFRDAPDAGEDEIRAALSGNICRCTGYLSILRGALAAQKLLAGNGG